MLIVAMIYIFYLKIWQFARKEVNMKYLLALIVSVIILCSVMYIIEAVPQQENWVISAVCIFILGAITIFGGGRI